MAAGQRTQAGFEALVKPQLPRLLRVARAMTRDQADAEELVQESCLKAFRSFHRFQPGGDARAWLITILLNTYRDWLRKTLKQPQPFSLAVQDGPRPTRARRGESSMPALSASALPGLARKGGVTACNRDG